MPDSIATDGFPKESHAHQLQENTQQILEALLKKIAEAFRAVGNWGDEVREPDIRVFISGKQVPQEELTQAQVEKLQKALEDPRSLKGSVWIKDGKELLFSAKNGEVKVDKLGLVQAQNQKLEATQGVEPAKVTQSSVQQSTASASPSEAARENSEDRTEIADLKETVERQAERIVALETKIGALTNSLEAIQNKSLSRWLSSTVSNTAEGLKHFVTGWAASKTEKVRELEQNNVPVLLRLSQPSQQSSQNSIQNQLISVEARVNEVKLRVDNGVKEIHSQLNNIHDQVKAWVESPTVQTAAKTAIRDILEPAVTTAYQRLGVTQSPDNTEAKVQKAPVRSHQTSAPHSQAERVIAAAEKLLEKIPVQTAQGSRSFQTGEGYLFQLASDQTISVLAPDKTELIRSSIAGKTRQTTPFDSFGSHKIHLERISERIEEKLSEKLSRVQTQTRTQTQSRVQSRNGR